MYKINENYLSYREVIYSQILEKRLLHIRLQIRTKMLLVLESATLHSR